MPKLQQDVVVDMDDGTTHRVVIDQRDYARWEVQDFAGTGRIQLQARFLGWSALKRGGLYGQPFDRFNNVDCIEVRFAGDDDQEDGEGEQGPRP